MGLVARRVTIPELRGMVDAYWPDALVMHFYCNGCLGEFALDGEAVAIWRSNGGGPVVGPPEYLLHPLDREHPDCVRRLALMEAPQPDED